MLNLTSRQIQILKTIIEEYIETAQAVGSEMLDKKYNLGVSPATIRNEMVKLTELGYLKQPHTSAGRTPTPMALKHYVNTLMQPQQLSVTEEVAVKEKIWDYRHEPDRLLREATKTLAERTKMLAVTTTDDDDVFYSGTANILDMPEFYDIDLTKSILTLLDHMDYWHSLLERTVASSEPLQIMVGDEFGQRSFEACGGVFTRLSLPEQHGGAIGVIGPCRLNYAYIIPIVKYMGNLLDEIVVR